VVLCKEIVADPGYLVFYTNHHSRKGRDRRQRAWRHGAVLVGLRATAYEV
jgi:pyridoxine/pyridoxamine 5'-phosphate oxidase